MWLAGRWADQLGPVPVTPHSDFFALGGASLAAAKLVSALRRRYPAAAVADVYRHPTLRELAQRLDSLGRASDAVRTELGPQPLRRLGLMQLAGVLVLFAIQAVPWLLATLAYGNLVAIGTPRVPWVWLALGWLVLGSPPARTAMQVLLARALLRPSRSRALLALLVARLPAVVRRPARRPHAHRAVRRDAVGGPLCAPRRRRRRPGRAARDRAAGRSAAAHR